MASELLELWKGHASIPTEDVQAALDARDRDVAELVAALENLWLFPNDDAARAHAKMIADKHKGGADRVTKGSVVLSKEVVAFLCGEGPLDGRWYGEVDDELRCKAERPAPYWWRRYLRAKGRK